MVPVHVSLFTVMEMVKFTERNVKAPDAVSYWKLRVPTDDQEKVKLTVAPELRSTMESCPLKVSSTEKSH